MPNYKYLGCGNTVTKTSKAGNQYLQRVVYLAPILEDGSTASAVNVYLTGERTQIPDKLNLAYNDTVFGDFNHKGYIEDIRLIPKN